MSSYIVPILGSPGLDIKGILKGHEIRAHFGLAIRDHFGIAFWVFGAGFWQKVDARNWPHGEGFETYR